MIEYVVNFDEMEETLNEILSSLRKKKRTNIRELKSKEVDFLIPPLKGRYEITIPIEDNETKLRKLIIVPDGYNTSDDFEIYYDNRLSGSHTFTSSVFSLEYLSPLSVNSITIYFTNHSGLYRNLKINLILIKEDNQ
jgi:hypothetical protein